MIETVVGVIVSIVVFFLFRWTREDQKGWEELTTFDGLPYIPDDRIPRMPRVLIFPSLVCGYCGSEVPKRKEISDPLRCKTCGASPKEER